MDSHHVEGIASYPQPCSFKYRFLGFPLAPLSDILMDVFIRKFQVVLTHSPSSNSPIREREGLCVHAPSILAVISCYIWGQSGRKA